MIFNHCRNKKEIHDLYEHLFPIFHPDNGGSEKLIEYLEFQRFGMEVEFDYEDEKCEIENRSNYEHVVIGNPYLSIIEKIENYASKNPRFNIEFVNDVKSYLNVNGMITGKQYNSLVNLYYSFQMHK